MRSLSDEMYYSVTELRNTRPHDIDDIDTFGNLICEFYVHTSLLMSTDDYVQEAFSTKAEPGEHILKTIFLYIPRLIISFFQKIIDFFKKRKADKVNDKLKEAINDVTKTASVEDLMTEKIGSNRIRYVNGELYAMIKIKDFASVKSYIHRCQQHFEYIGNLLLIGNYKAFAQGYEHMHEFIQTQHMDFFREECIDGQFYEKKWTTISDELALVTEDIIKMCIEINKLMKRVRNAYKQISGTIPGALNTTHISDFMRAFEKDSSKYQANYTKIMDVFVDIDNLTNRIVAAMNSLKK